VILQGLVSHSILIELPIAFLRLETGLRHSAFAWASSTVTNFISEILNAENPAAPGRLHRTGVERR
jgi:hypothetical protein